MRLWRESLALSTLATVLVGLTLTGPASAVDVGQKAPDFTLAAAGGKQITLADLTAQGPVVIYTFIQAFGGV
jgi:AhpC/TSA family